MPIFQSFNPKIKAWVKYHFVKGGFKVLDVKEREPKVPFKHVPKKGKQIPVLQGEDIIGKEQSYSHTIGRRKK